MIVIDGRARVTHRGRVIAEIGPGELIGEMALLNGSRRSATVVALTPMRLMVLNPGEFQEMLRVAPSVRAKVGAVAFERGAQPRRTARDGRGSPVLGSNDASAPVGDARAKGGNHASVRLA
jgi:CRP-like cAMP-binding protein